MWTLKSIEVTKNLNANIAGERLMMHVNPTFTDGTDDVSIPFTSESKEQMDNTLRGIESRLNNLDDQIAMVGNGYAIPPVPVPPTPPVPTPEELKKAQAEQVLNEARQLKEMVALGVKTQSDLDAKVAEYKTLTSVSKG